MSLMRFSSALRYAWHGRLLSDWSQPHSARAMVAILLPWDLLTPHDVPEAAFGVARGRREVLSESRMREICTSVVCVQRRLACSAGERPAGARVRSPVVWIAGWRETKTLKPIDNVSLGKTTSHRAVTTVNAKVASKMRSPEGRVLNRRAKAAWGSRNLTDAAPSLRRGGSDSTVARTCRATGEALLVPARNRRSRVDRITGSTGKSIEGEKADGWSSQ